jgi:hypothetical protein
MNTTIRREFRVAFSRRAQPVRFRIAKWICILVGVALFHDQLVVLVDARRLGVRGNVAALVLSLEDKSVDARLGRMERSGSGPRMIL